MAAALSQSRTLFELGLVVVLAAAAPLIAQVIRLPSILALLTTVPVLFDDSASHHELLARIEAGAEIAVADGPAGADGETDLHARLGADGMLM